MTDALVQRLRRYRSGGESLTATAYWMLTKIEAAFGGRRAGHAREGAANALRVDEKILATIGRLSARADSEVGRKAKGDTTPLNGPELAWLESAITRLTRRAGEFAASSGNLPIVTMSDLPKL